ncbi:mucin-2-like [Physella acuta]|uniref:mucin-2-like n=1 Tax=Physella acuta TaxID=109671 RepID=UPI0027DC5719|nr:mucin-2-like [Physella acuta]XP_059170366.1 mucin-2-like [Physella acuta]
MKAQSLIHVLFLVSMTTWADQNCMQQVLNPADIFRSDNATAVPIGQYTDESLQACNNRCCQSVSCNVAVVDDSDVSRGCELYACPSTTSCNLTLQAGQLVFVRQPPGQVNDSDVLTDDSSTFPTSAPLAEGPVTQGPATQGPATQGPEGSATQEPATQGPATRVLGVIPSAGDDLLTPLPTTLSTLTSPKATPLADYLTPPTAEMTAVNQQASSINSLTLTDSPTAGFELPTYQTTTITTVPMVTENTSTQPSLAANDSDAEGESYISGVDARVSQNNSLEGSEQSIATTSQLYNIAPSFTPTLLFTTTTVEITDVNATNVVSASSSLDVTEVTSGDVILVSQAPNSMVEAIQLTMQLSTTVPLDTLYYSATVGPGSDVAETEPTNSSLFNDVVSQSAPGNGSHDSTVSASQQPTDIEPTGYYTDQVTELPTSPPSDQVTGQPSIPPTESPTVQPTTQSSGQPVLLSSDLVTDPPSIRPTDQQTGVPNEEAEEEATLLGGKSANESGTTTVLNYHGTSEAMIAILISVLALGCVFVLTIVGVLGKRIYDGYQKRHYSRLDYLINGMYN